MHEFEPGPVGAPLVGARPDIVHELEKDRVGAPLVGARLGAVPQFNTGRDKPVPYGVDASPTIATCRDMPM